MKAPPIHHFRSSSFKSEREYLKEKWVECLTQPDFNLPSKKVKIYDLHRNLTEYYRVFLEESWPENGGDQSADQLMICTAMCDNANGNIHDKTNDFVNEQQQLICKDLTLDGDRHMY